MDTPELAYLSVEACGFEVMRFRADVALPVPSGYAGPPGWEGGAPEATSWVAYVPEDRFEAVSRKVVSSGAKLFDEGPAWRQDSHLAVSALDPIGVTVGF